MFAFKNNYYLYIENTKILDLSLIKKRNKFNIIYRNDRKFEKIEKLISFKKKCKEKGVKFFIANNAHIATNCKADGLYISSHNKNYYNNLNLKIIGSAHNQKEFFEKEKQGCSEIVLSRLFKTEYLHKKGYLGVIKFNLLRKNTNLPIIALGGIRDVNLNKLKLVSSNSLAILSEIKKKPVKIINRLF
ncbi:MAG: thiamine phosphate synthase [Pelagibacteraceae bacterium]